jgi:O-antigen/teichoic acid export membrane protein
VSIVLARIVSESDYGYFAIAFSFFLFFSSLSQAFILEPLNVLGTLSYAKHPREYFESTFQIQTLVSLGLALVIGLGGLVVLALNPHMGSTLLGLSLCVPPLLAFVLLRRFYYLHAKPEQALLGSLTYAFILLVVLYLAWKIQVLGITTAFLFMALGSGMASVLMYVRLKIASRTWDNCSESLQTINIFKRHWELGRWMLAGAAVGWLCTKIYIPLLGALAGAEAAASLKALENLTLPMDQFITSVAVMVLPVVLGKSHGSVEYLRRKSVEMSILFSLCVVLYVGIVIAFDKRFFSLLYGQDNRYVANAWALPILGIVLVVRGLADAGMGIALRALERFDVFFKAAVCSSVATLSVGVMLVYSFGFLGAVVGKVLSSTVYLIVVLWHFRQISKARRSIPDIHQIYPLEEFKNG